MKNKKLMLVLIFGILLTVFLIGMGIYCYALYSNSLSSEKLIKKITSGNDEAVLTVGIIEDGKVDYKLYGKDGIQLPSKVHTYAIGSITKTFTGLLIAKLQSEGKIDINAPIDKYIDLKQKMNVPTLRRLVTHTSGLRDQWEEALEKDINVSFSRDDLINTLYNSNIDNKKYDAYYSNFGTALAGTVAGEALGDTYENVMNKFIKDELKLSNTKVGGKGDLKNYWEWKPADEMMASGAIISNIDDMLAYAKMHLDCSLKGNSLEKEKEYVSISHTPLENFDENFKCAYFWIVDEDDDIIWHNGQVELTEGKKGFQSFIGFSKSRRKAVVVLSNATRDDLLGNAYTDLLGYSLFK